MDMMAERIEPVLAYARERLAVGDAGEARRALGAALTWLELHRPPVYEAYAPAKLVKERLRALEDDAHSFNIEEVAECTGDVEQIVSIARMVIGSAILEAESSLVVDVFRQDDPIDKDGVPCVALGFDGFGRIPDEIMVGGSFPVPLEDIGVRWTLATKGGRIERAPNGVALRLKGVRKMVEPTMAYELLRDEVEQAAKACKTGDLSAAQTALAEALALLDQDDRPAEPTDIKALVQEVAKETTAMLQSRHIDIDSLFAPELPPILVKRSRLRSFFVHLLNYATRAIGKSGAIVIMGDYANRSAELSITFEVPEVAEVLEVPATMELAYQASLRRVIEEQGGAFTLSQEGQTISITATLPDKVALALDEWIPGWDVFSDKSKQVLRLIKSGGPLPPVEIFLAGMLEEELERWLLPLLEQPAAVNIAHELKDGNEQRKKALTQIRKGKVKKEAVGPAYAAEILAAYNGDDRGRGAIGAQSIGKDGVERLSKLLAQGTPDYVECLRMIARVRRTR